MAYSKESKDREIVYGRKPDYSQAFGTGKLTDLSTPEKREAYRQSTTIKRPETTIRYKIIDKYSNQQVAEFYDSEKAQEYLKSHQKIGKVGELKGKEVFAIRKIDLEKQRLSAQQFRNRRLFRKEMFGF
jgi:hypothetical protein